MLRPPHLLALVGVAALCAAPRPPESRELAPARCRFTVRDVAFADLGDEAFRLEIALDETSQPALSRTIAALASVLFVDANVIVESFEAGARAQSTALVATLIAPDDRRLEIPLRSAQTDAESMQDTAAAALESVASSALRSQLLDVLLANYGAALLIEGPDQAANVAAAAAIEGAFEELAGLWDRMPKDVGEPPRLLRLPHAERADEKVLLWSLGIQSDDEPVFAMLCGRGRRLGPVLSGAELRQTTIFSLLSVAGLSCECGLDRVWMQGPRIPLIWDAVTRERAAEALGFDPDSPLVQAEMRGILSRGPQGGGPANATAVAVNESLLAYGEWSLPEIEEPGNSAVNAESASDGALLAENPEATSVKQPSEPPTTTLLTGSNLFRVAALFGTLCVSASLILIIRRRRH